MIKTQSLTAAITGTLGKVSNNMIAILEGEVTLLPSRKKVPAGSFARINANGSVTISPFDPASSDSGKLMKLNGPMPGFDEKSQSTSLFASPTNQADQLESIDIANSSPSSIRRFFPEEPQRPDHTPKDPGIPQPVPRPIPRD